MTTTAATATTVGEGDIKIKMRGQPVGSRERER
jgi:hypothetical protein